MAIYVGENKALLLKNDKSVVELYKGNKQLFGYNNSVQGEIIAADNVHPIEHKLKVKLSSDTIDDFSGVTVTRCGKNLFDGGIEKGCGLTGTGNNRMLIISENSGYKIIKVKPNTTYCLSGDFTVLKDKTLRIASFSEYPTESFVSNKFVYGSKEVIFKTTANDNYLFLWFISPSKTTDIAIQVEEGTQTDYKPYNMQIAKSNADGTVEGLTSLSPDMTIFSDSTDAVINISYC